MAGLTTAQAKKILVSIGPNTIPEKPPRSILLQVISQFANFLSLLLFIAAVFSFYIQEITDGVLILFVLLLNAAFGVYQEYKATEAIAALKKMTFSMVRVLRDGEEVSLDSRELVPGDVVVLEEGMKVPGDGIILSSSHLEANEASLTGESLPSPKQKDDPLYMGTVISKGRGTFELKATGLKTQFGRIATELSRIPTPRTPLEKKLDHLTMIVGFIGIVASVLVFSLSAVQGVGYFPSFLLAISLAVAVVPEGLPVVMTMTLAIGTRVLAQRNMVVRKLSSIEALGSITVIATDKTGTLTANEMKVREFSVDGKTHIAGHSMRHTSDRFSKLLLTCTLCSSASLVYQHERKKYDVLGDPTEGALLYLAQENGCDYEALRSEWKTTDEKPFDSITKTMTVQVTKGEEKLELIKGAYESILSHCSLSEAEKNEVEKVTDVWASEGLRILGFAYRDLTGNNKPIFLGMVALYDPPRPEVKEAVKKAHEAGIKVVMITGDNERTAEAIGVQVGIIGRGGEILTGAQIEEFSDEELLSVLPRVRIIARATPFHKARIVRLYQKLGEIVAVTGDGVNDAIALKQADVGIAMGKVGTDVARETADMVLLDDNFATIVEAIEEGRNIVKNIRNAIKYLLATNASETLVLIGGLLLGLPYLFTAIQFLYINLITDGIPAFSLAFSPHEDNVMRKSPQRINNLLTSFDIIYITTVGFLAGVIILWTYFLVEQLGLGDGRTAAFTVLVIMQPFIFIDLWLTHHSIKVYFKKVLTKISLTAFFLSFAIQYLIVTVPFLAEKLKVTLLSPLLLILCTLIASSIFLIVRLVSHAFGSRRS
ncbi:cation-translocating P-type ATPase [Candidatus Roizmanbacteria bacterium]|nr:cation-translocating P-type ATPase [Candidatus Roizmanbacteria bacterium]